MSVGGPHTPILPRDNFAIVDGMKALSAAPTPPLVFHCSHIKHCLLRTVPPAPRIYLAASVEHNTPLSWASLPAPIVVQYRAA